ncbi:DUF1003 domain-containing protein [Corynebacterium sp. CCM 9185]|uniref:DUF1003 domain-containing protein n=1 Tax=Corynebacterium marambiense TaxID=2765364 RepID=A0ABS0VTP2_9CORY|nr:DUF1003 domain-containing protein [Corynebacterium marambiense]MBI9000143.1 DUF1003 domain-containing protein [Corynebacterium marambiense]MCK7663497.1 DUF1003 domain-containing protein [Corynebacterium marambiense]MCX7542069.1 DUF1003 domain-containing protein [Corynebacterium marambiense]
MADYQRIDLDTPVAGQRRKLINIDGDSVGAFAEKVARFFGTGEYLFWQTIFVIIWIALNVGAWTFSWDPYPFILLNLAFSTQAAYAAPLILLAQNRQEDRDRVVIAEDRRRSEQTKADTEFLARELAGVRIAVGETVTRDYLRRELEELTDLLERLEAKIDDESAARQAREHLTHGERDGKDLLAEPTMGEIKQRDDDNR